MVSEARSVLQDAGQQDNFRDRIFVGNREGLKIGQKSIEADTFESELLSLRQLWQTLKPGVIIFQERIQSTHRCFAHRIGVRRYDGWGVDQRLLDQTDAFVAEGVI